MSKIEDLLIKTISDIESGIDHVSFLVKRKFDLLDPVYILSFHGFGNTAHVHLKGRVMEDEHIVPGKEDHSVWQNIRNAWKRFETDEIPGVRIRATFQGQAHEVRTDAEGYFDVSMPVQQPLPEDTLWHEVLLELLDEVVPGQSPVKTTGQVMVPPGTATYGVISDVDDTILVSRSTEALKKIQLTFFNNARTRLPFKGVAAFYQALQQGSEASCLNPIFYVSSSPWNLYDLLLHFCEVHDIPAGPLLLRDLGVTTQKLIKTSHLEHKMQMIRKILDTYPDLPFVLIGDSGQRDIDIYEAVVNHYPGRIKAVYIRDVTGRQGDEHVGQISQRLQQQGVDMRLCNDTYEAARHAAQAGLIRESAVAPIYQACERDD